MSQKKRGFFAGVSTLAAAALLLAAGGPAALAAPTIDPDATGTINFHKFEQPDSLGGAADGLEQDTDGFTPMPGVKFTAEQVDGIDLSTNDGWIAAGDMTVAEATAADKGFTKESAATDDSGDTVISDLPVGLYLITETEWPAGVTPAAPFLITVPLTDPSNQANWLYDIHVYPKNAAEVPVGKTVEDADAVKIGDEIVWTVTSGIPKADPIDGYRMVDVLDSKLDYVGVEISLSDGRTVPAEYFDVDFDAASNTLTIQATPAGLVAMAAIWQEDASLQLVAEITTTVNAVGEIENEATVFPNKPSFDWEPGEPGGPIVTPPSTSKFGNIVLEKIDSKDGSILEGAEFQVFLTEADAKAGTNPIEIEGRDTWTSTDAGIVLIEGLRYTAFADGEELTENDDAYQTYWIVETKAPNGYELLAQPVEVVVDSTDTEIITAQVKNVPTNGDFDLPLTGATGTAALTIAGVLLLAGALVLGSRRRTAGN